MSALLLLAACGETAEPSETAAQPVAQTLPAPEARRLLTRDRIYYDLTRYDWYARGEPLVHGQSSYQPAGAPVAASLDQMEREGEYQGVEYYRRDGDETLLYVPVFDGYWLGFRPTTPAPPANAP